jgi:hypothetical protein
MQLARPAFAMHPKRFGKGPVRDIAKASAQPARFGDDLKLFAMTFAAGFVFVSVLIG